jgi:anti-sigma factor RsiW
MSGLDCHEIRLSLGVYVVGAIDPADRATVEEHLSRCPDCREELVGLAGLPALLGRVPPADAERLVRDGADVRDLQVPSAALLGSLLDQVAARRRARRWRVLAAAAAAAVIAVGGGVVGGLAMSGQPAQHQSAAGPGWPDQVKATSITTHVTADVSYAPAVSGTTMQIRVIGVPDGTTCDLWVVAANGHRELAGAWTVMHGHEHAWYDASSLTPTARVSKFQITAAGKLLVSIPAS